MGAGLSFNSIPNSDLRLGVLTPGFSETFAMTLTELPVSDFDREPTTGLADGDGLAGGDSISSSSSHGIFATRSTKRKVVGSGGMKWALPEPRNISSRLIIWSRLW
jgi:hypothetical protein